MYRFIVVSKKYTEEKDKVLVKFRKENDTLFVTLKVSKVGSLCLIPGNFVYLRKDGKEWCLSKDMAIPYLPKPVCGTIINKRSRIDRSANNEYFCGIEVRNNETGITQLFKVDARHYETLPLYAKVYGRVVPMKKPSVNDDFVTQRNIYTEMVIDKIVSLN